MMARYLVHVVGDVHQPLHSSSLFDDDKFKNGDEGGNLYLIKYQEGIENLHKLFDSGVAKFNNGISRPLKKEDHDYIEKTAREIISEFHQEDLPELKSLEFADWIQESHDVSYNFIYKNIAYGGSPSESFINEAFNIIKRRIALGGYRLANLFKAIKKSYDKALIKPVREVDLEFLRENSGH
jgi:hypothetical protein